MPRRRRGRAAAFASAPRAASNAPVSDDPSPRNIHVVAAAAPRLVSAEYPRERISFSSDPAPSPAHPAPRSVRTGRRRNLTAASGAPPRAQTHLEGTWVPRRPPRVRELFQLRHRVERLRLRAPRGRRHAAMARRRQRGDARYEVRQGAHDSLAGAERFCCGSKSSGFATLRTRTRRRRRLAREATPSRAACTPRFWRVSDRALRLELVPRRVRRQPSREHRWAQRLTCKRACAASAS